MESDQYIALGDRIRFSVSLLRQIYEEPDHVSVLVELVEVQHKPDGAKWLVLKRCEARDGRGAL